MRLILFDVDGTLVNSQGDILGSMAVAFERADLIAPSRADILSIVGLSLPEAMTRLAPGGPIDQLVEDYKTAYAQLRMTQPVEVSSPLYPGARALLEALNREDETLLGVATGKSKRGLDGLIEQHGLRGMFVTQQCADFHPSKPHPSMVQTAMGEAGVSADRTVMIGDTSFDIDMGKAAGVRTIGVTWGYHTPDKLAHADHVVDSFDALAQVLNEGDS